VKCAAYHPQIHRLTARTTRTRSSEFFFSTTPQYAHMRTRMHARARAGNDQVMKTQASIRPVLWNPGIAAPVPAKPDK
jgi:hypothetical protein